MCCGVTNGADVDFGAVETESRTAVRVLRDRRAVGTVRLSLASACQWLVILLTVINILNGIIYYILAIARVFVRLKLGFMSQQLIVWRV